MQNAHDQVSIDDSSTTGSVLQHLLGLGEVDKGVLKFFPLDLLVALPDESDNGRGVFVCVNVLLLSL